MHEYDRLVRVLHLCVSDFQQSKVRPVAGLLETESAQDQLQATGELKGIHGSFLGHGNG